MAEHRDMTHHGRLESINRSGGGVPKTSVFEALVTEHGLDGDRQRDRRFHGGADRAVVVYSLEVIQALQREGHPIAVGSTGENLTVSGLDWRRVAPGAGLAVGAVRLLITRYVSPCETVAQFFLASDFTRISQTRHPGWSRVSARVLTEGIVHLGDPVVIVSSPPAGHPFHCVVHEDRQP